MDRPTARFGRPGRSLRFTTQSDDIVRTVVPDWFGNRGEKLWHAKGDAENVRCCHRDSMKANDCNYLECSQPISDIPIKILWSQQRNEQWTKLTSTVEMGKRR